MDRTYVFVADTGTLTDERYDRAYAAVSDERQSIVDRLRSPMAKRASLGAELLLQHAAATLELPLTPLERDAHGKPHVTGNPFFFNLSHSGSVAVCAVSGSEVGCDIEHPKNALLTVTERICSDAEKAFLTSLAPTARCDAALRFWTLKESAVKALGTGLSAGMERFVFSLGQNEAALVSAPIDIPWKFREFRLSRGARIAVCGETAIAELQHVTL